MNRSRYQVLYSDIGGVLGTNGWDGALRRRTVAHFGLSLDEIDPRHNLVFDSFERGHLPFRDYLRHVFFAKPRAFTLEEIRDFIYSQSVPWQENIEFFRQIRQANSLKLALISNEGEGITDYRVERFGLRELADFMVISHCVHYRKPDHQIWKLALDLAQVKPEDSIYIDDREMFSNIAAELRFHAFQHVSLEQTRARLLELGLEVD
jgi:putative hydrolase of the HAD superfamily